MGLKEILLATVIGFIPAQISAQDGMLASARNSLSPYTTAEGILEGTYRYHIHKVSDYVEPKVGKSFVSYNEVDDDFRMSNFAATDSAVEALFSNIDGAKHHMQFEIEPSGLGNLVAVTEYFEISSSFGGYSYLNVETVFVDTDGTPAWVSACKVIQDNVARTTYDVYMYGTVSRFDSEGKRLSQTSIPEEQQQDFIDPMNVILKLLRTEVAVNTDTVHLGYSKDNNVVPVDLDFEANGDTAKASIQCSFSGVSADMTVNYRLDRDRNVYVPSMDLPLEIDTPLVGMARCDFISFRPGE
jgi:hypothetical protein